MTDERDMRAAEYVLGSQPIEEREAVRRDMARDPILRAAVTRWEERLAPLAQNAPAVAPSPGLRARIKAGLPPRAANDDIESLRDAVRRWRNMAVLMGGETI